ncbi:hypothetical protein EST38_g5861 [Candolleomyces aberdarensis]|uniref:Uncharacterized protein n=1 Tax=Candolleomyces aberdarensis TaxID=2316362 RepID=A0A4Q2DLH1_9AGAR|nr:hypothetical protein EST38_g5861 [Candolleomyces aberdarensis]
MLAQTELEIRERQIRTEYLNRIGRELEGRRSALTQQLDEINSSLSGLWTEYGLLHNSGAYVNRIPTEILCQIFSSCLNAPKLSGDGYYTYEERPCTEVVLTHVCQHWRNVAIHDPNLWRSFRYKTPRWKRDPINRFNSYLQRSNPTTIDLFIHFNFSSHEDMTLLSAAVLQVHRWRRVTIVSEDNKFNWSPFQLALKDIEAPSLEYFSFRPSLFVSGHTNSGHVLPVSTLEPKIFTLGAPKLAHIHLDSTVPYFFLPPLSNITTFSLDAKYIGPSSVTWDAFLDILALPGLTNLSIGGEVLLGPSHEQLQKPIQANTLQHLRWSVDPDRLNHFLSYLSAPKLETLVLCRMHLPSVPSTPTASISLPSLRSLYIIECANLASSHYIRFLASGCPNIAHLSMSYYRPESGHLLGYLNQEIEEGRCHWTNLETVTTYIDGADTVAPYLSFVQPRKRPSNSLNPEGALQRPLTLRVSNRLLSIWKTHLPEGWTELKDMCNVTSWTAAADILPTQWPPGCTNRVMENDRSSQFNFAVDWNEF